MARETGSGGPILVSGDPEVVAGAERIVLPGVGAFPDCRAGLAGPRRALRGDRASG